MRRMKRNIPCGYIRATFSTYNPWAFDFSAWKVCRYTLATMPMWIIAKLLKMNRISRMLRKLLLKVSKKMFMKLLDIIWENGSWFAPPVWTTAFVRQMLFGSWLSLIRIPFSNHLNLVFLAALYTGSTFRLPARSHCLFYFFIDIF